MAKNCTDVMEYIRTLNIGNSVKMQVLRKCFSAVVDRKDLELTMTTAIHILICDLKMSKSQLHYPLVLVLTKSLVYYMTTWPGWSKSIEYFKGALSFKSWFMSYKLYLTQKMDLVVTKFNTQAKTLGNEACEQTEVSVVQNGGEGITNGPYELQISAPKDNFHCNSDGTNVTLEYYNSVSTMEMSFKELLNWPFLELELKFPNFHISRRCLHECRRYLMLNGAELKDDENKGLVTNIYPMGNEITSTAVQDLTASSIEAFLSNFSMQIKEDVNVTAARRTCLQDIFEQITQDIQDTSLSTIPTKSYIVYNIGTCTYFKTGNAVEACEKTNKPTITEIITPRVMFSLVSINLKDTSCGVNEDFSFAANCSCLSLKCSFCEKDFVGPYAVAAAILHFSIEHPYSGNVTCCKCRKQFEYKTICGKRWTHGCL